MEFPLDKKILDLFSKGYTESQISIKMSIPKDMVEKVLERLGIY